MDGVWCCTNTDDGANIAAAEATDAAEATAAVMLASRMAATDADASAAKRLATVGSMRGTVAANMVRVGLGASIGAARLDTETTLSALWSAALFFFFRACSVANMVFCSGSSIASGITRVCFNGGSIK